MLEENLNTKYMEESKKLYEEFTNSASSKKGNFSIDSDYEKVTELPDLLSVRRTIERTQAY